MTTDRINQIECRRRARVARIARAALSLSFSKSAPARSHATERRLGRRHRFRQRNVNYAGAVFDVD